MKQKKIENCLLEKPDTYIYHYVSTFTVSNIKNVNVLSNIKNVNVRY